MENFEEWKAEKGVWEEKERKAVVVVGDQEEEKEEEEGHVVLVLLLQCRGRGRGLIPPATHNGSQVEVALWRRKTRYLMNTTRPDVLNKYETQRKERVGIYQMHPLRRLR